MASTREAPGAYDALEKAAPDELIFVLLARDHAAPPAITEWTRCRRMKALRDWGGPNATAAEKELLTAELKQCAEAERVALDMAEWRAGHSEVVAERASYNAVTKSAEEQVAAADRRARESAHQSLHEAAYYLELAREYFEREDLAVPADSLAAFRDQVNRYAAQLRETRPGAAPPELPLEVLGDA